MYWFVLSVLTDCTAGGGTRFNDLGITVEARKGRAVLWPSLMDSNLSVPELRTHHEALTVQRGIKFGANLWIHQYDFKTPSGRRCELTFKNTYDPEAQLPKYIEARRGAGLSEDPPISMKPGYMHTYATENKKL